MILNRLGISLELCLLPRKHLCRSCPAHSKDIVSEPLALSLFYYQGPSNKLVALLLSNFINNFLTTDNLAPTERLLYCAEKAFPNNRCNYFTSYYQQPWMSKEMWISLYLKSSTQRLHSKNLRLGNLWCNCQENNQWTSLALSHSGQTQNFLKSYGTHGPVCNPVSS